jgi:hypothetical protein
MRHAIRFLSALYLVVGLGGCTALTPDLIAQLAKDDASICVSTDIRGGVGAVAGVPTGGYGQATGNFCRSKMPNAKIELKSDGSISIQHGVDPEGQ